jgi:hypothetical protein
VLHQAIKIANYIGVGDDERLLIALVLAERHTPTHCRNHNPWSNQGPEILARSQDNLTGAHGRALIQAVLSINTSVDGIQPTVWHAGWECAVARSRAVS